MYLKLILIIGVEFNSSLDVKKGYEIKQEKVNQTSLKINSKINI